MPPKKQAAESEALPVNDTSNDAPVEEQVAEKPGAAALRKLAAHPTTAVMIREALTELDSRKGVSSRAIQTYIKQKYPSIDPERLKNLVKRALRKGIETGTYVRPAKSNVTTGATGMFRLAPKVKESKAKSENTDPNVKKVKKTTEDGAKKPTKAGTTKKGETVTKEAKTKKDPKPAKKSKKDEEAPASKPAPAKKPKAKKSEEKADGEETSSSSKTKDSKTAKGAAKTTKAKAGTASQSKATKGEGDASAPKAPGKRGKKTAE
ncbi:linker histone H1M [Halichoeres trimaculatus]|uniref:linker histone H1M n=1 Tax=Halichoeres trimaculatus TaxID=147232 RepID=UPI003D9F74E0